LSATAAIQQLGGVGQRLRAMRLRRDWTLQELSSRSGLSVSMLSQVERDLASPSVRSLQRLAETFAVPIGWFFSEAGAAPPGPAWIQRRTQRRVLDLPAKGITKEMLSADTSGRLQLMLITIEPDGSSGEAAYSHAGEDAGTVLEGVLQLEVDGEPGVLSPGDSFQFASTLPHRFANSGRVRCVVLWAVTPPLY
jgi:transcriptional regulator with XRE-family HTH domain